MARVALAWWCVVALMCGISGAALAQEVGLGQEALDAHNASRAQLNTAGMWVLLSWAGLNLAGGAAGWLASDDPRWRSFHQMNAAWNTVNLTIGLFGLRGARASGLAGQSLSLTLAEGFSMEKLLALNVGLDVAYMAAGWAMWERGRRVEDVRWVGGGQSVIMQGAFLFVFDIALLAMNAKHNSGLLERVTLSSGGVTVLF